MSKHDSASDGECSFEEPALPTLDQLKHSFERGDYPRFRQLVSTLGGRQVLEENAGTLLSYFVEKDDESASGSVQRLMNTWRVLSVIGLRVLLEEFRLPQAKIQTQLAQALQHAVLDLDVEKVRLCLQAGASPNIQTSSMHSALHALAESCMYMPYFSPFARKHGKAVVEMAELLCKHGANVHEMDERGMSPVDSWLYCCSFPLEERDNPPTGMDADTSTQPVFPKPGERASPYDELAAKVLEVLFRYGGRLPDPLPKESSLPRLLTKGLSAFVQKMVDHGASVHAADSEGRSPLHFAILCGTSEVVECMLRRGAAATEPLSCRRSAESVMQSNCNARQDEYCKSENVEAPHRSRLLDAALRRGSAPILQLLQKVGIVATSRADLLFAAFSLDPGVFPILMNACKWSDIDTVDALKLQSAVLVAVNHLKHGHLPREHTPLETPSCEDGFASTPNLHPPNDIFDDLCPGDLLNCFQMEGELAGSAVLLSNAEELLGMALKKSQPPNVDVSEDQLSVFGQKFCEAATVDDLHHLKQLEAFPTSDGGSLCGLHFHTLLVLKRLAPQSQLYLHYLIALASNLWGGFGMSWWAEEGWLGTPHRYDEDLLACYEVVLQLSPTALTLTEQQPSSMAKCFGELAVGIARLITALCTRGLVFDAEPLVQWLCRAVENAPWQLVSCTAHLVACVLCLLAQAKRTDANQRSLEAASKAVSTMLMPNSECRAVFQRQIMLDLLNRLGVTQTLRHSRAPVTDVAPWLRCADPVFRLDGSAETKPAVVESVLVALLDAGTALPEEKVSAYFVRSVMKYKSLFRAMLRRGLDILSFRLDDKPLLAFAVSKCSAEIVECMLEFGAGQDWLDFRKAQLEKQRASEPDCQVTLSEISSRWRSPDLVYDLPDVAVRRGDCQIVRALHHSGIRATNPATLYEAALHISLDTLEFLIDNGQSWQSSDLCDALRLQSALCLLQSLSLSLSDSRMTSLGLSEDTPTPRCTTCQNGVRFQHSSACPLISTAFRAFSRAAAEASRTNLSSAASATSSISLEQSIQQNLREAQSEEELEALGGIVFASSCGDWVRGWHFHALLVMERLRCPLRIYEYLLKRMVLVLCGGNPALPVLSSAAMSSAMRSHPQQKMSVHRRRRKQTHPSQSGETGNKPGTTSSDKTGNKPGTTSSDKTGSKPGTTSSVNPSYMRSLRACVDLAAHLAKLLSPRCSATVELFTDASTLSVTFDWIGQIALWLLTNGVAIDYTAIFALFSHWMTRSVAIYDRASLTNRHVQLFLASVAHKNTLGRHQLTQIAELTAATLNRQASWGDDTNKWIRQAILEFECRQANGASRYTVDHQSKPHAKSTLANVPPDTWPNTSDGLSPLCHRVDKLGASYPADSRLPPAHIDEAIAEVFSLLLENGLELPHKFREHCTLNRLLKNGWSSLLGVLIEHGADMWTCSVRGCSLIVDAVRFSSPALVDCLLQSQSNRAGVLHDSKSVDVSKYPPYPQTWSDALWMAAVLAAPDDSMLNVLAEWRIPATKAALLQSALRYESVFISFMLQKLPFTAEEAADALKVHAVECLFGAEQHYRKSQVSGTQFDVQVQSVLVEQLPSELPTLSQLADLLASNSNSSEHWSKHEHRAGVRGSLDKKVSDAEIDELSIARQLITSAVESFKLSLHYCQKSQARPVVLEIAGHCIREAHSLDELKQLAQVNIATQLSEPLNGLLLHGLLVVNRILPKHSVEVLRHLLKRLCQCQTLEGYFRHRPKVNVPLTGPENALPELIPVLSSVALLIHQLRVWQELPCDEQLRIVPHYFCKTAIDLLRHLLSSGIIVDMVSIFSWLSDRIAVFEVKSADDCGPAYLEHVFELLIDMAEFGQESVQMSKQLHGAAEYLVKASLASGAPRHSILHCAVHQLLDAASRFHSKMSERRRLAVLDVIRILLEEGGPRLVNLVNDENQTAAHQVIFWAKRGLSEEAYKVLALELLTLFDLHGQHWDCLNDSQKSLLELLGECPRLSSFSAQLPLRTLQCLSASVAVAWCGSTVWEGLPANIKAFILEHRRGDRPLPHFRFRSSSYSSLSSYSSSDSDSSSFPDWYCSGSFSSESEYSSDDDWMDY